MAAGAAGERDLAALLAGMRPELRDGAFVFVSVDAVPGGVAPLASFVEDEGLSLVLRREQADGAGLGYDLVCAWIVLRVHSALDAVGLTAAVAHALTAVGMPCNVIAARHHDHLPVPHDRAQEALAVLQRLSEAARPLPGGPSQR